MAENNGDNSLLWVTIGTIVFAAVVVYLLTVIFP